jgi:hypothetical protein
MVGIHIGSKLMSNAIKEPKNNKSIAITIPIANLGFIVFTVAKRADKSIYAPDHEWQMNVAPKIACHYRAKNKCDKIE